MQRLFKRLTVVSAVAAAATVSGCASIVHAGPRVIPVDSSPQGATVTIYDRDNRKVMQKTTPFVAELRPKYRYFGGQTYRFVFELSGHEKVERIVDSELSGWYFGNIVFGGLIGALIVDPLTGAMFNLAPEKIEQVMTPEQKAALSSGESVVVLSTTQLSAAERSGMVPLAAGAQ